MVQLMKPGRLGLPTQSLMRPGWAAQGSSADLDFKNQRYWLDGSGLSYDVNTIPGWSFVRSGSRYSDTSAGALTSFGANTPRITDKGLAADAGATNLLTYSQAFDNAAWTKTEATISADATTAPDGTTTADKAVWTTANSTHLLVQGVTSAANTFSIYAKASGETVISLWVAGAAVGASFNLSNGTIGFSTVTSSSIEDVGSGWYRCTVYDTTVTTAVYIYGRTGGAFVGNETDGVFLWGAQWETGARATPHIPTTTASASAGLDTAALTDLDSLGLTSAVLAAGYTVVAEYSQVNIDDAVRGPWRLDAGGSTLTALYHDGAIAAGLTPELYVNASNLISVTGINAAAVNKVAARIKDGDSAVAANGNAAATGAHTPPTDHTQMLLGRTLAAGQPLEGYVRRLTIYPSALSNAQLQAVTA